MGYFRFLTEIRFFQSHLGHSWDRCRSGLIILGGVHATLQQIYGLSILPLCDFYWLLSTLNIVICDASLLLSPIISTHMYHVHETSNGCVQLLVKLYHGVERFTLPCQNELSVEHYNDICFTARKLWMWVQLLSCRQCILWKQRMIVKS